MSGAADAVLEMFLCENLSECVEKLERIEGGAVNFTFRLHFKTDFPAMSSDVFDSGSLLSMIYRSKPTSLIVKLALPHMAVYGEHAPFSTNRQNTEEQALKLFRDQPISNVFTTVRNRNKSIKVARVWFRDPTRNILIMDDHGAHPTLEQWFIAKETIFDAQRYGDHLGVFIADMQVASLSVTNELRSLLHNSEYDQYILTEYFPSLEHTLKRYEIADALQLTELAIQNHIYMVSCATVDENVLLHGDLWPQQFLLDTLNETLAVLDWEFACVASPAVDPAHLLAYLRVLLNVYPSNEHVLHFMYSFIDGYQKTVKKAKVNWYENPREQYLFAWTLGIVHGYILIKVSTDRKFCLCENEKCAHQRAGVVLGAEYLRRCRSGPDKTTYDLISRDHVLCRFF